MKTFLFLAAMASCSIAAAQGTTDQSSISSSTQFTGGTSARNLPGYAFGQSFTAGRTGTLTGITMGFFGDISGSMTLQVFAFNPATFKPVGAALATLTVPVISVTYGLGGVIPVNFNHWNGLSVPVVAGQVYCFLLTPQASMPDPYGIPTGAGYSGGFAVLVDAPADNPTHQGFYGMGSTLFQTRVQ